MIIFWIRAVPRRGLYPPSFPSSAQIQQLQRLGNTFAGLKVWIPRTLEFSEDDAGSDVTGVVKMLLYPQNVMQIAPVSLAGGALQLRVRKLIGPGVGISIPAPYADIF